MTRTSLLLLLATLTVSLSSASWTGAYQGLGQKCDPNEQNGGVADDDDPGKVCFPGSYCNPKTKICDCEDKVDGGWLRTFQNKECRLLPGSTCVPGVDQDYYRCVENSVCSETRPGKDKDITCPADAPCDKGDHACKCQDGKTCVTEKKGAVPF